MGLNWIRLLWRLACFSIKSWSSLRPLQLKVSVFPLLCGISCWPHGLALCSFFVQRGHDVHRIDCNWISYDSIKLYTDATVFCCRRFSCRFPEIWHGYNTLVTTFPVFHSSFLNDALRWGDWTPVNINRTVFASELLFYYGGWIVYVRDTQSVYRQVEVQQRI